MYVLLIMFLKCMKKPEHVGRLIGYVVEHGVIHGCGWDNCTVVVRPALHYAVRPLRRVRMRHRRMACITSHIAAKPRSLPPAASVDRLIIMLSKLKVVCALEADWKSQLVVDTGFTHLMLNEKQVKGLKSFIRIYGKIMKGSFCWLHI